MARPGASPTYLFGYDASLFTQKMRVALRIKQIPYTFIQVPSMMPRPILKDNFGITYRRIPVLSIGKEFYADTTVIIEALELHFPHSKGYPTLYPDSASNQTYRPMARGFACYWMERPLYRVACGLMSSAIWKSSFGRDREGLIGHKIDPDKLEKKVPQNLSGLDLHLSLLEPMLHRPDGSEPWIFDTVAPSHADVSLYAQLDWAEKISRGEGINSLTAGEAEEGQGEGCSAVFNEQRYPGVYRWFTRMRDYLGSLPLMETRIGQAQTKQIDAAIDQLRELPLGELRLVESPAAPLQELDERNRLFKGAHVYVRPDDTGQNDPNYGTLVGLNPEEIVIVPDNVDGKTARVGELRVHFPRAGFVVKPVASSSKL